MIDPDLAHCIEKIALLVEAGQDSRRDLLQLGYNLGRLSELTGLGREPFWDRWKDAVTDWDLPALRVLVRSTHDLVCRQLPRDSRTDENP